MPDSNEPKKEILFTAIIIIIITASFGSHAGTPFVASSPQLTALRRGAYMIEHMHIPT
jgi:hypothetical protein